MASSCVYMSAMILLQETDFLSLSPSPCQKHNIFGDEVPMEKHGHITEFDPGQDDWSSYVESLEHYLAANDVLDANKKRSILLQQHIELYGTCCPEHQQTHPSRR